MNRVLVLFLFCFFLYNCSSDDEVIVDELDNTFFELTRFAIETAVDINNDGIFSNNLLSELDMDHCIHSNGIGFRDNQVNGIIEYIPTLNVLDGNTDNSRYDIGCAVIDYFTLFDYAVEGNMVSIGDGENPFVGVINDNTITFNLSPELSSFFFFNSEIIGEDGEVQFYDDTISLTYTLVE